MPLKFKKDQAVQQKVKPIQGVILGPRVVDDDVKYEVAYTDEHGEPASRIFDEDDLEAMAVPEDEAPADDAQPE